MSRKIYWVKYRLWGYEEKGIQVCAKNVAEAYDIAVYELIPEKEVESPYSAWVDNVTYANGNVKYFNSFEGKRY